MAKSAESKPPSGRFLPRFLLGLGKVLLVFLGVCSFLFGLSTLLDVRENEPPRSDGFEFESYDTVLDVRENGEVLVEETLRVNFTDDDRHGIFTFKPEWLEYTGAGGETVSRKSRVRDLVCVGEPYELSRQHGKIRLRIGDPTVLLPEGPRTYVIRYVYDMGKDPFRGYDAFIFHAFGDLWGPEIRNPSLTVRMPKSFDPEKVRFFTDKHRTEDVTSFMDRSVSGSVLTARLNTERYGAAGLGEGLTSALTVDVPLPDHYFTGARSVYGVRSLLLILAALGLAGCVLALWVKYGKDYKKRAETVEYYPPDDLNAAEIGYIAGMKNGRRLTVALIVQLASKGYIRIDEVGKKGNPILITNLCCLPELADGEDPSPHEANLEAYKKELKPLSKLERLVYDRLFCDSNQFLLREHSTLYLAFEDIAAEIAAGIESRVRERNLMIAVFSVSLIGITFGLFALSYCIVEDLNPALKALYALPPLAMLAEAVMTVFMGRKTRYGEEISARVRGFRRFLEQVEKPQLEKMVEENPRYYYDILPYTYVMNVSKKWIRKFEDIPFPKREMGSFNYFSSLSYRALAGGVAFPKSSGGGGGGCSSCGGGGGCSSCGGGGAW